MRFQSKGLYYCRRNSQLKNMFTTNIARTRGDEITQGNDKTAKQDE